MRFSTLILRNLLNRPVRTTLTVVGLSVGIAAVVALIGIAWGFERSFLKLYATKGIDLVATKGGVSNGLASSLDVALEAKLKAIPGVKDVAGSLVDTVSFEDAHLVSVLINGWEPNGLLLRNLQIVEGRNLRPDDQKSAVLGRVLALNLGKKAGDQLDVAGEMFAVVGIFESESLFESGSLIVPIRTLQSLMGRQNQVTAFVLSSEFPADRARVERLANQIEKTLSGVAAVRSRDYVDRDVQIRLSKAMAWATSFIAVLIGSVGILNTMVTAVYERTGEIGVLRAIGWKRKRVLAMIMGEAVALGLLGAIFGSALAFVFVRLLLIMPTSRNFIDPNLPLATIGIGLAMGLGLSLLGGLYPAMRAAALDPTEALRRD